MSSRAQQDHRDEVYVMDDDSVEPADPLHSSMLPNYPPSQPLFHIPPVPQLTKVPAPGQRRRPPVAGYDIKTLRKQIEYLQDELSEKTVAHELLYVQNEELWKYTQDLLLANKSNAIGIKEHIAVLYQELQNLHNERHTLAEKLIAAKNSNQLISKIEHDIHEMKSNKVFRLEKEAEQALYDAKRDAQQKRNSINEKMENLSLIQSHLDDHRNKKVEDDLELVAINFYNNSNVILNNAYQRFKKGMYKLLKLSSIKKVLEKLNKHFIILNCWGLWKFYMKRIEFMKHSIRNRKSAICKQFFSKWSVYSAVQVSHRKLKNKYIVKGTFKRWRLSVNTAKVESANEKKVEFFKLLKKKRFFLSEWKRNSFLIGFNSTRTLQLQKSALRHFTMTILIAWKKATRVLTKSRQSGILLHMPLLQTKYFFQMWLSISRQLWGRRGRLMRSFFLHVKRLINKRKAAKVRSEGMFPYYIRAQKRCYMQRFKQLLDKHRYSAPTLRLGLYLKHSKLGRSTLLYMKNYATKMKRQHKCIYIAVNNRTAKLLRHYLGFWYSNIHFDIQQKEKRRTRLLVTVFGGWSLFTILSKREKRMNILVGSLIQRKANMLKSSIIQQWLSFTKKRRRCNKLYVYVSAKTHRNFQRKFFIIMRNKWTQIMYWTEKESHVDNLRRMSLLSMKEAELKELESERERNEIAKKDLEQSLLNLNSLNNKRENQLKDTLAEIDELRISNSNLAHELSLVRDELEAARRERERLQGIEQLVEAERGRKQQLLEEKKREANNMIMSLQRHNQSLRDEVLEAKEQSFLTEKFVADDLEAEQRILDESLEMSSRMKQILFDRENLENKLISENKEIAIELNKVKKNVDLATERVDDMLFESDKKLRLAQSEVNTLKLNTSVATVRVQELQRLVVEKRRELQLLKDSSTLKHEELELSLLKESTQRFLSASNNNLIGNLSISSIGSFDSNLKHVRDDKSIAFSAALESETFEAPTRRHGKLTTKIDFTPRSNKSDDCCDENNEEYENARRIVQKIANRLTKKV